MGHAETLAPRGATSASSRRVAALSASRHESEEAQVAGNSRRTRTADIGTSEDDGRKTLPTSRRSGRQLLPIPASMVPGRA
jgi:hypothetical protein